jgi:hypothetical protein
MQSLRHSVELVFPTCVSASALRTKAGWGQHDGVPSHVRLAFEQQKIELALKGESPVVQVEAKPRVRYSFLQPALRE